MSIESMIKTMAKDARAAAGAMGECSTNRKNQVLRQIADRLQGQSDDLKRENLKDLESGHRVGLSDAMIDRLTLSDKVIQSMVDGLLEVAELKDPIGTLSASVIRPNGLEVARMRIPLGVIGIIYESRPNVTIDAAALCLKAGNAVILRGGSEAFHSNQALAGIIGAALSDVNLPEAAVQVVPLKEREAVEYLLQQEENIDLIIPRGGEGLIRFVVANSKIPVLKHYKGVCHVFVDEGADLEMAQAICFNAKVQRPGVCNAMETMLIHQAIAPRFLPDMAAQFAEAGVELRGCQETCRILPDIAPAQESDWPEEYLSLTLAVKVVQDINDAIEHIERYSSKHTEAIVTSDYQRAHEFVRRVDSSVVLVNASTRFNDGNQLGLGAEIGISTSKLHAFGPMGVEELTTTKFVVYGNGQLRS